MKLTLKISKNNTKLGKIASFSLPSIKSCLGATIECKNICYAHKIERIYKNAAKSYEHNLLQIDEDTFVEDLSEDIKKIMEKKDAVKVFRWHISGDIINISYLHKIKKIMENLSDITFYAYTRNWSLSNWQPHIDSLKEISNFTLIASMDDEHITNNILPDNTYRIAYVGSKSIMDISKITNRKIITCPNQTRDILCDECTYCFNPKLINTTNSVYFIKH